MPRNSETGTLTPGVVTPLRSVPAHIKRPPYVGVPGPEPASKDLYTPDEIERIRKAGRIAGNALQMLETHIRPGITTEEIDALVHEYLVAHDAYPSTLEYLEFPKSCCTSLNEVICHGIPDDTELVEGDILNVDITAYIDGMHGDTNRMYTVGTVSERDALLIERTKEAMMRGIKAAKVGRRVNVIGRVIESYAKRFGYGVVRDYTGHGVGEGFHSGLIIPHYDSDEYNTLIEPGMVFTIEPMLTLGGGPEWEQWDDDWTIVTADRSRTAQFEHTLVVTEAGPEILTLPDPV